jgi:hypothetical protein
MPPCSSRARSRDAARIDQERTPRSRALSRTQQRRWAEKLDRQNLPYNLWMAKGDAEPDTVVSVGPREDGLRRVDGPLPSPAAGR